MSKCCKVNFDTPALKYTGKLAGLYEGDLPEPTTVYTQLINDILNNNTENTVHKNLLTRFVYSLYVQDLGDPFPFNDICRLLYFKIHNIPVENENCVYVHATVDDEEIRISLRNDLERAWAKVLFDIWQKTTEIITWPYEFIADGKPLYDWTIEGNLIQSGTPSPTNPIYPSECGNKTANLFDKSVGVKEIYVTPTVKRDGFEVSLPSGTYTVYSGNAYIYTKKKIGTTYGAVYTTKNAITLTLESDGMILIYTPVSGIFDNANIMLNSGSTALPYQPYGYAVTPKVNNNSYPIYLPEPIRKIGDYLDVLSSEGKVVRRIKKLVLTGEENWTASSQAVNVYYCNMPSDYLKRETITTTCSHFVSKINKSNYLHLENGEMCLYSGSSGVYTAGFYIANTTLTDFKTYLAQQYAAGTPVTVWYVLAIQTEESVEVPVIDTDPGNNAIDVETTLKPSKMTITYS